MFTEAMREFGPIRRMNPRRRPDDIQGLRPSAADGGRIARSTGYGLPPGERLLTIRNLDKRISHNPTTTPQP
jgi:hypothetical protein